MNSSLVMNKELSSFSFLCVFYYTGAIVASLAWCFLPPLADFCVSSSEASDTIEDILCASIRCSRADFLAGRPKLLSNPLLGYIYKLNYSKILVLFNSSSSIPLASFLRSIALMILVRSSWKISINKSVLAFSNGMMLFAFV